MTPPADTDRYKHHCFPPEIISHGVWLYYRFTLSYPDVQESLFERGIEVSHEAIYGGCQKFGQDDANQRRRRRPQPGDNWHLDKVWITINGKRHYLWRAVSRTTMSSICWCRVGAIARRPRSVSASCSKDSSPCRVWSSPTH